ncbi:ATP-binding protein [Aquibacillus saliphilus]|uniref:ATP-binding protein n=1 Tax=Aquibacillus saliphilus TaxID=1909422 RepID=UPI001CEFD27A|nr:ATP-binding protein [Aquibacillus saliphilus]
MNKKTNHNLLLEMEEIKGLKLFLTLFYLFLIGYDFIYFYVFPYYTNQEIGLPAGGLDYWYHLLFVPILFISFNLIKRGKVHTVKYLYLFSYIVVDLINIFLIYYGTDINFATGNAAELVFIFFSSLFINKKFFWVTLTGIVSKYVAIGVVLFRFENVIEPISLYGLLAIISYILLTRFSSNLNAHLKVNDELRQAEQLATVGQIATSITHEIRNPLTSLKGLTQLQMEKHPEDIEYYQIMTHELERINSILDDLLVIGRPKQMVFEMNNLQELIEYVGSIMDYNRVEQAVEIFTEVEGNLPEVECNSTQIKQVLINIFKNGIEAMPAGGNLFVKVEKQKDDYIKITVTDEGDGISKENLELIGNPFHTTKSGGTGLGLMVSFKVIEEHRGEIYYDSEQEKGTTVTILLPIYQKRR